MIQTENQQKRSDILQNVKKESELKLSSTLFNFLSVILGIAAAYFMTIQSLRLELAQKAEDKVVSVIDKKLINLEVILKEGVVSKEEFFKFSKEVDARLSKIEYYLSDYTGDKIDRKNKFTGEN